MNRGRATAPSPPGLGGDGGLQKLTIYPEKAAQPDQKPIQALFNPAEIGITRAANWEEQHTVSQGAVAVEQAFRSIIAERFSIELFFDTYEPRSSAQAVARLMPSSLWPSPVPGLGASDVRQHTDRIARLVELVPGLHRPPKCDLRWGTFDIFSGVLATLHQRFTLFLDDGTPVRATLTCEFVEVGSLARARAKELRSADVIKTRLVRRTDTLQSLAADEYGDPALWRPIAIANGIVNPRDLRPGTMLTIPRLRP